MKLYNLFDTKHINKYYVTSAYTYILIFIVMQCRVKQVRVIGSLCNNVL